MDEEAVKKLTGQAQVPVLLVNGTVIPDSTAIVNWLEQHHTQPALMPITEKDRAQAMLWEELMDGVLGPQARMLIIGHFLRSSEPELQQGGRYFAQKYQHTSYAEERAKVTVERILTILKHALDGRQYLVGDTFTRADLTTASMLLLVKPPPDDLFLFPASMRPMYTGSAGFSVRPDLCVARQDVSEASRRGSKAVASDRWQSGPTAFALGIRDALEPRGAKNHAAGQLPA